MSIKIHHSAFGALLDSYIPEECRIPLYEANRDFSRIHSTWEFEVKEDYSNAFTKGDEIRIVDGTNVHAVFKVKKAKKNYNTGNTTVLCQHRFADLLSRQSFLLTEANLNSLITNTTGWDHPNKRYRFRDNYYTSDPTYDYSNAAVIWVINRMFNHAGIFFLESDIDEVVGSWKGDDYTYLDIAIDIKMLWAINQNHAGVVSDGLKITYWDFISKACAFLGIALLDYSGGVRMIAQKNLSKITVNKDESDIYFYEDEDIDKKAEQAGVNLAHRDLRADYYSGDNGELDKNVNTDERETNIDWHNNMRFMLRDLSEGADDGDLLAINEVWLDPATNTEGLAYSNLTDDITKDFKDEVIETEYEEEAKYDCLKYEYNPRKETITVKQTTAL